MGVQVAMEVVRCAEMCGSRESRLGGHRVSSQGLWSVV